MRYSICYLNFIVSGEDFQISNKKDVQISSHFERSLGGWNEANKMGRCWTGTCPPERSFAKADRGP